MERLYGIKGVIGEGDGFYRRCRIFKKVKKSRNDRGWVLKGAQVTWEDVFRGSDKMYDLEFSGGADKWPNSRNFRPALVF